MLGGHYPILFSTKYSWLLIALVIVIGGLIRHFFNSQHAKKGSPWWTWILSFIIVLIMIYITNLGKPSKTDDLKLTELSKSLNQEIFGCVFCRTKIETQKVADRLINDGYKAAAIHGDLSQNQRDAVMKSFRLKKIQLLIATDVAARGIDVDDITHVINY